MENHQFLGSDPRLTLFANRLDRAENDGEIVMFNQMGEHNASFELTQYLASSKEMNSPPFGDTSNSLKIKIVNGKKVKIWQCGVCAKEFNHQYTLMRHLPTHTDERKYQCNVCGKAFRQMSTLSQHKAIHSVERPYVCEVCSKTFNRVSTLISHRKTHTDLKPHRCHLCHKAFHQKGNLRNHIFTHTNERPYKCDICQKGFNQMSNLMCHKLKIHDQAEKVKFTCKICGEEFLKRHALRNHESFTHGIKPDSVENVEHDNGFQDNDMYDNAIIVDAIKTEAMQLALQTNQTPFALLRPINGIPVLVRVMAISEEKQILVPASAEELKKCGQISIKPKDDDATNDDKSSVTKEKRNGTTIQIKVPVVATVIQQRGIEGQVSTEVISPGPSDAEFYNSQNSEYPNVTEIKEDSADDNLNNSNVSDDINFKNDFSNDLENVDPDLLIDSFNSDLTNSSTDEIEQLIFNTYASEIDNSPDETDQLVIDTYNNEVGNFINEPIPQNEVSCTDASQDLFEDMQFILM
ncbi:protein suppressor of hairy wing-like isoform X2 [Aethina tumida]|uniref:protein suppressor of hairy wing-like isoform X2 n=1 Tax=Aethina tumida TaxID=116153 RepID=UPI00096B649C|nr:protein suppressor of hairy wing-like isoform X2 [Aethina tumida]